MNSQDGSRGRSFTEMHTILQNLSASSSTVAPCSYLFLDSFESGGQSAIRDLQNLQEQSMLGIQPLTSSETKNTSTFKISKVTGTRTSCLQQSQEDSQEGELPCKHDANVQKHHISHHQNLGGKNFVCLQI